MEIRSIPFFNYKELFAQREAEYFSVLEDVFKRGAYIMQQDLADFESELASYLGVKHAIGVADGTMAMVLALKAAGIGQGDEVIVPSHTFVASAGAIKHVGATPVLVDCGRDHMMDPQSARQAITSSTRAIMPVQLNGRTCDMDSIEALANEHKLKIVEDSCQALGSKYNGKFAGTFGVAGSFSFYPAKTLGCFGDGGALVTDDSQVAELVLMLRDHGRNTKTGLVEVWGYNSRLDNLQAAILKAKLAYYDQDIQRRRAIASIYDEMLRDIPQLLLPPAPSSDGPHYDIYQNYEIEAENRDALREHLSENGVGTILQWGGRAIHQFPDLGLDFDLPYTEEMTSKFLLLPMNTTLTDEDVVYIAQAVQKFYA